jgi:hypothetical protein
MTPNPSPPAPKPNAYGVQVFSNKQLAQACEQMAEQLLHGDISLPEGERFYAIDNLRTIAKVYQLRERAEKN